MGDKYPEASTFALNTGKTFYTFIAGERVSRFVWRLAHATFVVCGTYTRQERPARAGQQWLLTFKGPLSGMRVLAGRNANDQRMPPVVAYSEAAGTFTFFNSPINIVWHPLTSPRPPLSCPETGPSSPP